MILFVTTEFAPITTLCAIVIFHKIRAPVPIYTLFPIIGAHVESFFPDIPIVTSLRILQLFPILACAFTTTFPWTI